MAELKQRAECAVSEESHPLVNNLTKRQQQVVECVAAGMTNREIGEQMGISPRTVGKHLEQIYGFLDIHSRTALARLWT